MDNVSFPTEAHSLHDLIPFDASCQLISSRKEDPSHCPHSLPPSLPSFNYLYCTYGRASVMESGDHFNYYMYVVLSLIHVCARNTFNLYVFVNNRYCGNRQNVERKKVRQNIQIARRDTRKRKREGREGWKGNIQIMCNIEFPCTLQKRE